MSELLTQHEAHEAMMARLRSEERLRFRYYRTQPATKPRPINPTPYYREMWFWELVTMPRKPDTAFPPSLKKILQAVAEHYGLSILELRSIRRTKKLVRARQVAMYLARDLTSMSFPQIGRYIGDRDHSTVVHGVRVTEERMRASLDLQNEIDALRDKLA